MEWIRMFVAHNHANVMHVPMCTDRCVPPDACRPLSPAHIWRVRYRMCEKYATGQRGRNIRSFDMSIGWVGFATANAFHDNIIYFIWLSHCVDAADAVAALCVSGASKFAHLSAPFVRACITGSPHIQRKHRTHGPFAPGILARFS